MNGDQPPSLSEPTQPPAVIPPVPPRKTSTDLPSQPLPAATAHATEPVAQASDSLAAFNTPASVSDVPVEDGFYKSDQDVYEQPQEDLGAVEWVSSGEELQSRSATWRVKMSLLSAVAGVVVYALTRDLISSGAVVFVGVIFGLMGARKPPALSYRIDRNGITVGEKAYSYREFRAFSLVDNNGSQSINLMPLKRFLPVLAVHYDLQRRAEITDILGQHLPLEEHRRDAFDSIITLIKF